MVSLIGEPAFTDAEGRAHYELDIPEYHGKLRLMAFAMKNEVFASAEQPVTVASPLLVEPSFPRFLAPGDRCDVLFTLTNRDAAGGTAALGIETSGPIAVSDTRPLECVVDPESEQTYKDTGRTFSVRKLDRVRVVGITEPVRLYELIDLRSEVDDDQNLIDKLRTFNSGLTAFENKEWADAVKNFQTVLNEYPDDGPAKYYVERSRKFAKSPPSPDWDGVFNLTKK